MCCIMFVPLLLKFLIPMVGRAFVLPVGEGQLGSGGWRCWRGRLVLWRFYIFVRATDFFSSRHALNFDKSVEYAGVALTQISAYITHKNPAVRKIVETIRTAYTKRGLSLNMSQTTREANDHGRHAGIVKGKRASFPIYLFYLGSSRSWRSLPI